MLVLELELALVLHPWYTAWDLAFHMLPLAIVDPDFAKEQMRLMLKGGCTADNAAYIFISNESELVWQSVRHEATEGV